MRQPSCSQPLLRPLPGFIVLGVPMASNEGEAC